MGLVQRASIIGQFKRAQKSVPTHDVTNRTKRLKWSRPSASRIMVWKVSSRLLLLVASSEICAETATISLQTPEPSWVSVSVCVNQVQGPKLGGGGGQEVSSVGAREIRTRVSESRAANRGSSVLKPTLIPKGPCTCMVYTWVLKLLYGNPFKAQVYTM